MRWGAHRVSGNVKKLWMAPLLKTTRVASSCWTDDNLIGFQVAQRSIETENHTAPSNNLPEKIPCAQIFINVSLETCIEEWILEAKTDLICVLCHNFWTNFDLHLFSTSKWPSNCQFCERYKGSVEKMTRNCRKMIKKTADSLLLSKHSIQFSALFLLPSGYSPTP